MKTWMTLYRACRSSKTGRFASKGRCNAFKKTKVRRQPRAKNGQFKLFAVLVAAVLSLTGCATQRTKLTEAVDADGTYTKTTEVKTRTFFDSKSELAKLKTSSTEKTQSVGVEGLKSESTSEGVKSIVDSAVEAAVRSAVKSVVPVP